MVSEKSVESISVPPIARPTAPPELGVGEGIHSTSALIKRIDSLIAGNDPNASRDVVQLALEIAHVIDGSRFEEFSSKLIAAGAFCFRLGRSADAIKIGRRVAELATETGNAKVLRQVSNMLGASLTDTADFAEAMRHLQTALQLARKLNEPFLETAGLANVVTLMQEMGHYRQTISLARKVISTGLQAELSKALRLQVSSSGLFAAHRIGDRDSALYFAEVGEENLPFALDEVGRIFFEKERAAYLIDTGDFSIASGYIDSAAKDLAQSKNGRVAILLGICKNLCAWASGDKHSSRIALRAMHEQTQRSRLYHNLVLQALIKVHQDAETAEDASEGLRFARELVEYTTSVKKAKFYRQLANRQEQRDALPGHSRSEIDPFATVRDWLISSEIITPPEDGVGKARREVTKHEELTAIHDDMAKLRVASIRREIRTDAVSTAENWAIAAEFFDDETGKHCYRVGHLASLLARKIGMDDTFCFQIELAARLHDIGKIAVNEVILLKPGPLDAAEMAAMRLHTEVGAQILAGSDDPTLRMATDIARHHHEWWNGGGYPAKLSSKDIPIAARICAYSDVYDALTNVRAYKAAWTHERAVEEITRLSGTQFDPEFLQPFLDVLEAYRGDLARDAIPGFADMDANALIASRKKLLETISEDGR